MALGMKTFIELRSYHCISNTFSSEVDDISKVINRAHSAEEVRRKLLSYTGKAVGTADAGLALYIGSERVPQQRIRYGYKATEESIAQKVRHDNICADNVDWERRREFGYIAIESGFGASPTREINVGNGTRYNLGYEFFQIRNTHPEHNGVEYKVGFPTLRLLGEETSEAKLKRVRGKERKAFIVATIAAASSAVLLYGIWLQRDDAQVGLLCAVASLPLLYTAIYVRKGLRYRNQSRTIE